MKKLLLPLLLVPMLSFGQLSEAFPLDKQLHFLAGSTVAGVTYGIVYEKTKDKEKAILYSILSSLAVGTLKEVYDSTRPYNRFDAADAGFTGLGGVAMGVTFSLFEDKKKK